MAFDDDVPLVEDAALAGCVPSGDFAVSLPCGISFTCVGGGSGCPPLLSSTFGFNSGTAFALGSAGGVAAEFVLPVADASGGAALVEGAGLALSPLVVGAASERGVASPVGGAPSPFTVSTETW